MLFHQLNSQVIYQQILSDYAAKEDESETLAEAVGDYFANRENAKPFSLEIVKLLKERLLP